MKKVIQCGSFEHRVALLNASSTCLMLLIVIIYSHLDYQLYFSYIFLVLFQNHPKYTTYGSYKSHIFTHHIENPAFSSVVGMEENIFCVFMIITAQHLSGFQKSTLYQDKNNYRTVVLLPIQITQAIIKHYILNLLKQKSGQILESSIICYRLCQKVDNDILFLLIVYKPIRGELHCAITH